MRFPDAQLDAPLAGQLYPIGSLFMSLLDVDPFYQLGYGVWERCSNGRAIVGVDEGDSDFDAAEKTVGAKTVTLSEAQMPAHTHVQNAHGHSVTDPGHSHIENSNNTSTGGLRGWGAPDPSTNNTTPTGYSTSIEQAGVTVNDATAVNQNSGGDEAHNNVQPSFTCFIWKRTE